MDNEKRLLGYNPITLESFTRHMTKHREPYDQYDMGYVDAVDRIEEWLELNTVDAVEVVHGRWEQAEYHGFLRCSECKDVYIDDTWVADGKWNYCPNCGAKMDGDGNA